MRRVGFDVAIQEKRLASLFALLIGHGAHDGIFRLGGLGDFFIYSDGLHFATWFGARLRDFHDSQSQGQ